MNIMVYSVAASSGGALSILTEIYRQCAEDKENHYYFIISTPNIKSNDNITVLRFPKIKKGWCYRLLFDYIYAPQLVKKYHIDKVLSTTNTIVPRINIIQTIYLHQPLPFVSYRFPFCKHKTLWIYQHIISRIICYSIKKANKIIVQTHWMKDSAAKKCNVSPNKFIVQEPLIDKKLIQKYQENTKAHYFFYPASPFIYKNHWVIMKSCMRLKKDGINDYQVVLTITGKENSYAAHLKAYAEKHQLPICFIGNLSREEVFHWYAKSILIFPSYIESYGMPLKEARLSGTPIIGANTSFAKEILNGYDKISYFEANDDLELSILISCFLNI